MNAARTVPEGIAQHPHHLRLQRGVLFGTTSHRIDFSVEKLASLDRSISAWRDEVILPLRQLRRRVKVSGLLNSSTEEFYRRIKADELLAERLEISAIEQQLERTPAEQSAPGLTRDVIERVVKYFADAGQQREILNDETIQHAISTLYMSAR